MQKHTVSTQTIFNKLARRTLRYIVSPFSGSHTHLMMRQLSKSADRCEAEQVLALINYGVHPDQTYPKFSPEADLAPLHLVAMRGHDIRIAEALLRTGATVDILSHKSDKRTPLFYATIFGNPEVTQILLKAGANVELQDTTGLTPIEQAIKHYTVSIQATSVQADNLKAIEVLAREGATVDSQCFFMALSRPDLLSVLQHHGNFDDKASLRDDANNTLLHSAAMRGIHASIPLLLQWGVDLEAQNAAGNTALTAAAEAAQPEAMKVLLTVGADPEAKNTAGLTCQHLLNTDAWQKMPEKREEILKLLGTTTDAIRRTWEKGKLCKALNQERLTDTAPPPLMRLRRVPRLRI